MLAPGLAPLLLGAQVLAALPPEDNCAHGDGQSQADWVSLVVLRGVPLPAGDADAATQQVRNCSTGQRLVFVHIPKNAGTAIEDAAQEQNISWGRFMNFEGCKVGPDVCPSWHIPPHLLYKVNMYTDASTFCVVRNPYARAVSEYSYIVAKPEFRDQYGALIEKEGCSEEGLNAYLQDALGRVRAGDVYRQMCHVLPQSRYVWSPPDAVGQRRQWCDEILHLEDFPAAFHGLMSRYGYDSVKLPARAHTNKGLCPNLDKRSISPATRELIREVYEEDFRLLNYED